MSRLKKKKNWNYVELIHLFWFLPEFETCWFILLNTTSTHTHTLSSQHLSLNPGLNSEPPFQKHSTSNLINSSKKEYGQKSDKDSSLSLTPFFLFLSFSQLQPQIFIHYLPPKSPLRHFQIRLHLFPRQSRRPNRSGRPLFAW